MTTNSVPLSFKLISIFLVVQILIPIFSAVIYVGTFTILSGPLLFVFSFPPWKHETLALTCSQKGALIVGVDWDGLTCKKGEKFYRATMVVQPSDFNLGIYPRFDEVSE